MTDSKHPSRCHLVLAGDAALIWQLDAPPDLAVDMEASLPRCSQTRFLTPLGQVADLLPRCVADVALGKLTSAVAERHEQLSVHPASRRLSAAMIGAVLPLICSTGNTGGSHRLRGARWRLASEIETGMHTPVVGGFDLSSPAP